ncbi:hypothetical protein LTR74_000431 [Friedmanniomyces endolithicus]|nr:hypothetical protein LTR74_000431 [Friedmanniomyces endolithicus]
MATSSVARSLPRALKRARWTAAAPQRRTVATATAAVEYHDPPTAYIPPPLIPTPASSRADTIRDAKPFSSFLTDTHAREHDYLRISLTERCNLRCLYCMPEEGIALSPPATQLTTPEIIYLCQLFVSQGVNKIRLTGGEPTVRKDILELMRRIGGLRSAGLKELALTTNGISLWRKLDAMVEAGLRSEICCGRTTIELDRRKGLNGGFNGGEEGWMSKERQLLETIGAAVKRKKAKHAGMGQLENMKNRPMILIGERARPQSTPTLRQRSFQSSPPWSRIPTHLLSSSAGLAAQTRFFTSSSVRRRTDDDQDGERTSGLATTLGFQSLSGLFQDRTPPRGRYSRPRVEQQPATDASAEVPAEAAGTQTQTPGSAGKVEEGFFQTRPLPEYPSAQTDTPRHNAASPNSTPATESRPVAPEFTVLMPQSGRLKIRKLRHPDPKNEKLLTARDRAAEKHHEAARQKEASRDGVGSPSPWASSAGTANPKSHVKTDSFAGSWGLSEEDLATVDTFSDPDASTTPASAPPDSPATPAMPTSGSKPQDTQSRSQGAKLTHVTSSGEAHMVDIGAKPSTRRVAVAVSFVRFSHSEPFRLIFENNNKKGDVLGVARIAGIMAAKRTADIIPLCHPIAISKVDVEVRLIAPGGGETRNTRVQNNHGAVQIQATVETVGPTGVEMEALSAVSGAALTVYDMCKAVDRAVRIMDTRVVYKCGGRSGEHVDHTWAALETVGRQWFKARVLEVPVGVVHDENRERAAVKDKRGKE